MSNDFINNNKFTTEQAVAVKNNYGNVLVSASAGSGKTKVLIGRIINLILDKKCKVKDLLVVTFTNAAADEMKARLKQELIKYNLLEELDDLNNADIFNLHKFCSKLIKEFFYKVSLDSSFNILAENEADYLLAECVEKSIVECVNDIEFQKLFESYNKNRNFLEFKKVIYKIHKFLQACEDTTTWLNDVLENSYNLATDNRALKFLNDYYVKEIQYAIDAFAKLQMQISGQGLEKLEDACLKCKQSAAMFLNKNFIENFENLSTEFDLPTIYGKAKNEEEKEYRQMYSAAKKQLQTAIDEYKKSCPFNSFLEIENALKINKNKVLKIIDFVNFANQKYMLAKQKINVLDFSDLEQYALKVLNDETVLNTIKERYKYIFVDEYQDTNSLQEKILGLITRGDNLFMVGDVKQSIYGFRFCNPQIFIDKYNKFENSLTDTNFLVNLNKNFRSDNSVLDFCNFVFSGIMTKETCGIDYSKTSMFTSGKNVENSQQNMPDIKISVFPEYRQENEIASGLYDIVSEKYAIEENKLDKQILFVANQIKELLNSEIFDENLNCFRKICYKDIAILSRNRSTTIKRIVDVFKQIKIPVNASYKTKLFESDCVNLVLNYLRVLDNFYQDIPLYCLLNSFLYNLSEEELAVIKLNTPSCKFFYENVLEFYENQTNADMLSQKILNKLGVFFKDVKRLTSQKEKLTLIELVLNVLNELEIENYFLKTENSEAVQNIKMFVEFIKSSGFNSVCDLLFYIDNYGADKTFDKNITDGENSVCVTTIHASKGLEYPIVFIIDAGNKFSNSIARENLVMDLDLGISTSFIDINSRTEQDMPTTKGIKLKKKLFEKQEEMRLLYVALTRAKTKLFVVGSCDVEKITPLTSTGDIMNKNSYMSWILGLLTEGQIQALIHNNHLTVNYSGSKFLFTLENEYQTCNEEKLTLPNIDFNTQLIKNYLNFKPQQSEEKLRYTVTEILQTEGEEQQENNFVFKLNDASQEIDYSKLGTIYHEIMQKIPFENTSFMDCKKEIPKLINFYRTTLTEKENFSEKEIETAVYILGEFLNKGDRVYKEVGFHLYDTSNTIGLGTGENKVAVQGVVDLIIERDNEVFILDYKTSRLKSETEFIKKYQKQLDLYALAVSKFFKKPVSKKIIYSFYLNRLIFVWQFDKMSYTKHA